MKLKNDFKKSLNYIKWLNGYVKGFRFKLSAVIGVKMISMLLGITMAIASKIVIDNAAEGKLDKAFGAIAIFIVIIIISIIINVFVSFVSVRIMEAMSNEIRQKFFTKFMKTEWLQLSSFHSGDLLTRMTSDVTAITNFIVYTVSGILALLVQLVAAFITLYYYDKKFSILAFAIAPIVLIFSRIWGRKLKELQIKLQESESKYRSYMQESLQNLLIIKTFGIEKHSVDNLQDLHNQRLNWVLKRNITGLKASTMLSLGYWIGYFLALTWGAILMSRKAITFGTMTVFLQLVAQIQGPFIALAQSLPQVMSITASIDRLKVLEVLENEKETVEISEHRSIGINFDKASFSYLKDSQLIKEVSLSIAPGEVVALMGESGEGKTTIVRILLSLLSVDDGSVSFHDDLGNAYEASTNTRSWISYVPQGNTLFSGTIADNLRYGKLDASGEEMEEALREASALEFIDKLPNGFDTVIGEKGIGLSEGQAQRIAIARALLRNSPVLILDEATSALDTKSEMNVLNAIKNRKNNCTCLVITHRPSAMKICNRVLRLEKGRLVEESV